MGEAGLWLAGLLAPPAIVLVVSYLQGDVEREKLLPVRDAPAPGGVRRKIRPVVMSSDRPRNVATIWSSSRR